MKAERRTESRSSVAFCLSAHPARTLTVVGRVPLLSFLTARCSSVAFSLSAQRKLLAPLFPFSPSARCGAPRNPALTISVLIPCSVFKCSTEAPLFPFSTSVPGAVIVPCFLFIFSTGCSLFQFSTRRCVSQL